MSKVSEKQKLINKYPQLKDEIIAIWNDKSMWARTYRDDTGTVCVQWEQDVAITASFKAIVIEMELETRITELQDNVSYITDGILGGLGILESEFVELQKLSNEPHGIYGN